MGPFAVLPLCGEHAGTDNAPEGSVNNSRVVSAVCYTFMHDRLGISPSCLNAQALVVYKAHSLSAGNCY